MGRIRVLPDPLINRIAAGEVVERPAAVVKELIENSLDAGAESISIRIEEGGRLLVEVADDGCGMDADDAVAALDRHATSKLGPDSALDEIATLGFRGEAIPSIAAVSRFALTTGQGEGGTRVVVEGGKIRESGPAPHPRGTTVTVRDLFYNTPARRRFLRAPSTELGHVVESFLSLAFARPAIRLRLDHGRKRLFDLPPAGDLAGRLAQIEGPEAAREAAIIDAADGDLRVTGYVVAAGETGPARRASRRLVVNGRVVRDRLLARAAARALEQALPSRSAPACLVVLEVPPSKVDVNVHPAKAEVRFAEPGRIHDLVADAVCAALGARRPPRRAPAPQGAWGPPAWRQASVSASAGGLAPGAGDAREAIASAAERFMARPAGATGRAWLPPPAVAESAPAEIRLASGAPEILGHYRSGYIIAADDEGLLLVDQHAAHERILFEEMTDAASAEAGAVQPLLFPRTVSLPAVLRGRSANVSEDLASLGFEVEPFGEETLIVRGVPASLADSDAESLVAAILSAEGEESGAGSGIEERRRRMLATAACHAAVKVPAHLTREKLEFIVSRLVTCRTPLKCPHGRPTLLRWDHRSLERRFGRP